MVVSFRVYRFVLSWVSFVVFGIVSVVRVHFCRYRFSVRALSCVLGITSVARVRCWSRRFSVPAVSRFVVLAPAVCVVSFVFVIRWFVFVVSSSVRVAWLFPSWSRCFSVVAVSCVFFLFVVCCFCSRVRVCVFPSVTRHSSRLFRVSRYRYSYRRLAGTSLSCSVRMDVSLIVSLVPVARSS